MNKVEAKNKFTAYLRRNNIPFKEDFDNGVSRITMVYKRCNNCPDNILESCVWFYENEMETRAYYDETASSWCKKSDYIDGLMRLLNFVNAKVWPCTADGMSYVLYKPHHLYTPRLYMTEDGYSDITMTTIVPYDFYEVAPLETEDFLTAACPELLDKLSPAIFGVLLGQLKVNQAIGYVKENILNDN